MIPDDYTRAYVDVCSEKGQMIIAKIAAIRLLHPGELVKWSMSSEDGIQNVELYRKEEQIPILEHKQCPCYYGSSD